MKYPKSIKYPQKKNEPLVGLVIGACNLSKDTGLCVSFEFNNMAIEVNPSSSWSKTVEYINDTMSGSNCRNTKTM